MVEMKSLVQPSILISHMTMATLSRLQLEQQCFCYHTRHPCAAIPYNGPRRYTGAYCVYARVMQSTAYSGWRYNAHINHVWLWKKTGITWLKMHQRTKQTNLQSLQIKRSNHLYTSNVTGRHRGPKRKLTGRSHYNARPIYASLSYVANVIFFIVACHVWYRALSLRYVCIRRLGIILIP